MEIATFGNIPILSNYCGIGCVFCKVHTDSYLGHYPKIPMIDEDDLIKGFDYVILFDRIIIEDFALYLDCYHIAIVQAI